MNTRKLTLALAAAAAAILSILPYPVYAGPEVDSTPPICQIVAVVPGPPKQLVVVFHDPESGIAAIQASSANAILTFVPPFVPGTTAPVFVVVTRINPRFTFAAVFLVTNGAGLVSLCDPVVADFEIPPGQKWVTQAFTDLPAQESVITVMNGNRGVSSVVVSVNGVWTKPYRVGRNKTLKIDVAHLMKEDEPNTIEVAVSGWPGDSATVLISDSH